MMRNVINSVLHNTGLIPSYCCALIFVDCVYTLGLILNGKA